MDVKKNYTPDSAADRCHSLQQRLFVPVLACLLCFGTLNSYGLTPPDNAALAASGSGGLKLPVIGIGEGLLNFIGDVGYSRLNQPLTARTAFQFDVQYYFLPRVAASAFFMAGHALGTNQTTNRTINFKSSIFSEGLMGRYEFNFRKNRPQILIPYLTAGVEYMFFHTDADLKDANGNTYYYWKDGSIKNIAESDPNASAAVLLHRDYNYETDLREANLDGLGKYRTSALAFPVGAGARFRISGRCSVDFSVVCHLVQSDMVDGISSSGTGDRQGNPRNDKLVYSSAVFHYDLSAPRDVTKHDIGVKINKEDVEHVDFDMLARDDSDGDGVPDVSDMSPDTPAGVKVDERGRPLDGDHDGVPDYRDKELNSAADAAVNEDGVTYTDEMIQAKFDRDSINALPPVIEYIKSYDKVTQQSPTVSKSATFPPGNPVEVKDLPEKYRVLDVDKNGVVSAEEISTAIDLYLNGKSPYSVSEFYELIDLFFIKK